MPMVNVSEKTLSKLKTVKDEEELKSLDATIRHLFKPPPRQTDFESKGPWPLNAMNDINTARYEISTGLGVFGDYYLVGPRRIIESLDSQLPNTEMTFRQFILRNKLVKEVVMREHTDDCVALMGYEVNFVDGLDVSLERSRVKILNIELRWPSPPSELTDEELLERLEENYSTPVLSEAIKRILYFYSRVKIQGKRSDGMTTRATC